MFQTVTIQVVNSIHVNNEYEGLMFFVYICNDEIPTLAFLIMVCCFFEWKLIQLIIPILDIKLQIGNYRLLVQIQS